MIDPLVFWNFSTALPFCYKRVKGIISLTEFYAIFLSVSVIVVHAPATRAYTLDLLAPQDRPAPMAVSEEQNKHFALKKKLCFLEHRRKSQDDPDLLYCNATFDSFSCWPKTSAGELAEVKCPPLSVSDPIRNVTRLCFGNGTWDLASYNSCLTFTQDIVESMPTRVTFGGRLIYNIGYTITTIALLVALAIFIYFKSLRCLRNTIHCHLIVAFLFNNLSWAIMHYALTDIYNKSHEWVCRMMVAIFNYFHSVPFYWMFVEGLYLYTIVVWAFSLQRIRLWYYVIIGWGVPLVVTVIWAVVKSKLHDIVCWLPVGHLHYDYILHGPVIFILTCNVFFITAIVWILVTKLRASNSLETRQSRKAVRAAVVLLPLLGLTFVMFLKPPIENRMVAKVFHYINAVMQSLQGLFVAVIYCFMNGEVQTVLRKKFMSFRNNRALTRFTKSSIFSSPHRSSCYAVPLTSNGKWSNSNKRASNGSHQSKLSRTGDPDNEAYASMIENVL